MPYAIITKKIIRTKNHTKMNKLSNKLGRNLFPNEYIYDEHEIIRYVCVIRPNMSDYEIRTTKNKKEAIFYLEKELPLVKHRLKKKNYFIIDSGTGKEIERIPAKINIALTEVQTVKS